MLADFFTKSLQGALFMRMHDKILNLPCSTSPAVHRSVLDLQDFIKGNEMGNETDGQKTTETTGNKDKTANMPAQSVQKNDNEKDTKKA